MYAPIYLPTSPAPASAVLAAERAIMDAEGPFHVGGRYLANDADARVERRRLAGRRVREAERRNAYGNCARGTCDAAPRFRLATLVTARERQQVDAGTVECVRTVHRDTLAEVANDLKRGDVDGAVISAARIEQESAPALSALVRGFPSQTVVGLIGEVDESKAVAAAVTFGRSGVRIVADVRNPNGWRELRNVFDCSTQPEPFIRQALAVVLCDIGTSETDDAVGRNEFFRLVFAPRVGSAKELAAMLGVLPSTLMSRFFRAGLPSPKQYVAYARLLWAAYLGESPAMSIAAIANRLNASSPQSFHRTVRTLMGTSAAEFRGAFNGTRMLERFRDRLVLPYRDTWRAFNPLADSLTVNPTPRNGLSFRAVPTVGQGRAA